MRFVRALTPEGPRVGVLTADDTVALSESTTDLEPTFGDDGTRLLELGEGIVASPASVGPLADLSLLAPVTPPSMRDFMVFEEHIAPAWRASGMSRGPDVWYHQPIGYFSNASTLRGPRDAIEIPGGSQRLDFELEVGAIVGRPVESVTPEQASGLVAGYLILCDWSARDTQFAEMDGRLGPFKGKDFGSSLGPVFVTPDEIADRRSGTGFELEMIVGGQRQALRRRPVDLCLLVVRGAHLVRVVELPHRRRVADRQRHLPGRLHPGALGEAQPRGVPVAGGR